MLRYIEIFNNEIADTAKKN